MNQELEIEFKNMLTKEEFEKISAFFKLKDESFAFQENHYFDTSNFSLRDKGCALRIRHKKGQYILTLKQPAKEGLLETNEPLAAEMALNMLQGAPIPGGTIKELISKMDIVPENIEYFGMLATNRVEINYQGGLLAVDHSIYLGKEDFELEYEAKSFQQGKGIFEHLLKVLEIPIRKTENKVRRFYKQKYAGK
ncbi:CYTH domain-containing protein [Peribacillus saganii]|uniref:CYTH domain-containing protein n=1 Tax=Peribacillus saganii TaxID=2303992 RepID=A0A372LLS9_9BACI|nr:CYTH domain-containing protein [Peribacillus saganii]RFU68013.1 CYTH domain-containing protein [Peribacillus saganii]